MAKLEIEVDDATGAIVRTNGELPDPVKKVFNEGFGKGAEKAANEAKGQIEAGIQAEIAKLKTGGAADPLAEEKVRGLEVELSKHREADALRESRHTDALAEVQKRHQAELDAKDAKLTEAGTALEARTGRIRQLATKEIGIVALAQGARTESVDELQTILGSRIALDESLQVYVIDPDNPGKPLEEIVKGDDGRDVTKQVSIDSLVAKYLSERPHHRSTSKGRSMGAGGGRSLVGVGAAGSSDVADAEANLAENPGRKAVQGSLAAKLGRSK